MAPKLYLLIAIVMICLFSQNCDAQILNRMKERVVESAENKVVEKSGEAADRTIDGIEEGLKGNKKKNSKETSTVEEEEDTFVSEGANHEKPTLKSYSKYDFIPGETMLFYEDFATDAIGDFPARWNTNVSGEVVTVNSVPGKWFKLINDGSFIPDGVDALPDNFTIEFDVLLMHHDAINPCSIKFDIGGGEKGNPLDDLFLGSEGVLLEIGQYALRVDNYKDEGYGTINSSVDNTTILDNQGVVAHISIWRQNQRLRLYLNETKIFDLPRVFSPNTLLSMIRFSTMNADIDPEEDCLVSNIRLAVDTPDMCNKLMTEGKLVTQGILFDVNSNVIKPESAGTLKNIASILKENPTVKVRVIGHTDSDGTDAANLALSKSRAISVKNVLNKEYGIDAARMETDGMGETVLFLTMLLPREKL